jgi:hypothetical protein
MKFKKQTFGIIFIFAYQLLIAKEISITSWNLQTFFDGNTTGKQTHTYFFSEDIHTDDQGNDIGDSIDLSPCDYLLSSVNVFDWESLFNEEVEVQIYE